MGTSDRSGAYTSTGLARVSCTVLLMSHVKRNNIHGFGSGESWDQFQSVTREDAAKQKTKEPVLIAAVAVSLCLSLHTPPPPPPPLSLNLFVRRAAARFWSTVVCLCQTPKRRRNEEGHMKRGRVTVATVCNHNHTHTQSVTTESCRRVLSLSLSPSLCKPNLPQQPFLETQVKSSDRLKFNWNCTELGEQQTISSWVQDRWGFQLPWLSGSLSVCVCVFWGW